MELLIFLSSCIVCAPSLDSSPSLPRNFSSAPKNVLNLLKKERVIDSSTNTNIYCKVAEKDMGKPLDTYFKTQVKEKYPNEVIFNDSVFFLPIIDRIFEMTNL